MRDNPSMKVGIDGTSPRGANSRDRDSATRRVNSVRTALIDAGVASSRIETGAFGDTQLARDGRVEVLLRSDRALKSDLSD
jgi:outer membrane protein OmpA-like peptidoglycan-associated protein